jgi:hypothetical protein
MNGPGEVSADRPADPSNVPARGIHDLLRYTYPDRGCPRAGAGMSSVLRWTQERNALPRNEASHRELNEEIEKSYESRPEDAYIWTSCANAARGIATSSSRWRGTSTRRSAPTLAAVHAIRSTESPRAGRVHGVSDFLQDMSAPPCVLQRLVQGQAGVANRHDPGR